MAQKYLGDYFDIHCGGEDHIPVHHTNEIAQTEARVGTRLANFWMHGYFLLANDAKMAKSAGEFLRVAALVDRGYDPLAFRYLCLTGHYRTQLNFTWEALDAAATGLARMRAAFHALAANAERGGRRRSRSRDSRAHVNDDLNTPRALAVAWEMLRGDAPAGVKRATLLRFDEVFGLGLAAWRPRSRCSAPAESRARASARARAQGEELGEADRLRNALHAAGWEMEDRRGRLCAEAAFPPAVGSLSDPPPYVVREAARSAASRYSRSTAARCSVRLEACRAYVPSATARPPTLPPGSTRAPARTADRTGDSGRCGSLRNAFDARKRDERAFSTPAHRSCDMRECSRPDSTGQDELLQRRKILVVVVDGVLESLDVRGRERRITGDRQFSAEIEQIVLDIDQESANAVGQRVRENEPDHRIQFIDGTDRFDARAVLRNARTVAEAGRAGIAGAGDDLRQPVAHDEVPGCNARTVTASSGQATGPPDDTSESRARRQAPCAGHRGLC